jgi:glycosyltransferase involved in cell wall biosynthesis
MRPGGSTDGTLEFFKEKGLMVYGQEVKGRGEAFRVAFRKAKGDALLFFLALMAMKIRKIFSGSGLF